MVSARMGDALGQIQRIFTAGTLAGLSDSHLLELFLDRRDDAAFTALVERHASMVLKTCQAVLRNTDAAEDAFQATFLVLVCKARSIRGRDSVGGWLHRVAYRIAIQAGEDAARKRGRERTIGDIHVEDQSRNEQDHDWQVILHEEVARLSERHRLPLVLCDLQGKTHAQAAHELNCCEATLRRRLTAARDLLRSRLTRRGVGLTAAGLAASLGRSANAGVPAPWVQAAVKAASSLNSVAAQMAIGEVISTATAVLVRKSLQAMLLSKLKPVAAAALVFSVLGGITWGFGLLREEQDRDTIKVPRPQQNRTSHNSRQHDRSTRRQPSVMKGASWIRRAVPIPGPTSL